MANSFTPKEERHKMNEIFKAFDLNMDGVLSHQELLQGFCQVWPLDRSQTEVDLIMNRLDINGTGSISYSGKTHLANIVEFIIIVISLQDLLQKDKIRAAFKLFDTDGNGKISI